MSMDTKVQTNLEATIWRVLHGVVRSTLPDCTQEELNLWASDFLSQSQQVSFNAVGQMAEGGVPFEDSLGLYKIETDLTKGAKVEYEDYNDSSKVKLSFSVTVKPGVGDKQARKLGIPKCQVYDLTPVTLTAPKTKNTQAPTAVSQPGWYQGGTYAGYTGGGTGVNQYGVAPTAQQFYGSQLGTYGGYVADGTQVNQYGAGPSTASFSANGGYPVGQTWAAHQEGYRRERH